MSGANTKSDHVVSCRLSVWLQPFSDCFTLPTWRHVLVLVAGAILSPGRRTVACRSPCRGARSGGQFHQLSSSAETE